MPPAELHIVVVVEDDPVIRDVVAATLEDENFGVIEAASADEGLLILEREAANVNVLFTDINTPGQIDGMRLATVVCNSWPHIAILLTSGSRFIRKPYNLREVVRHIREVAPLSSH
jgi:DNA-binding response OmpR family regulator